MAKKGSRSVPQRRNTSLPDIALGSFEAAAVVGTHWSRPAKMAKDGTLVYKPLESGWTSDRVHEVFLYSFSDCDDSYHAYLESVANGTRRGRPRVQECLDQHDPMVERLAEVDPILYDDAIGTAEAAAILGVHITMVNRMVREGVLRARKCINDRRAGGSLYIISRRSCEENRAKYLKLEASGSKPGLKRTPGGRGVVPRKPPVHRKSRPY